MKKLRSFIPIVFILFAGCVPKEKPVYKTEIGLFTPYSFMPEILNGRVKKLVEKNYLTREDNGKIVADRLLTTGDRDSINWTNDLILTFNEEGLLLQCDQIDENGKVIDSRKSGIDGGKIVRSDHLKADSLAGYDKVYYDSNGWMNKVENYSSEDTLKQVLDIKTDDKGNIDTVFVLNSNNEITWKFEFSYNEANKRSGYKSFNTEGIKTFEQKYFYNDKGILEKQLLIDKDGIETEVPYTYTYDDNGNWIECIGDDGKIKVLAKREIEYYD